MLITGLGIGIFVGLILLIIMTPRVVEYVETITIKGSDAEIYDAIRYQESLMEWSAWPSETSSTCHVEAQDGEVGAMTVFVDKKGKRFGHQTVEKLSSCRYVSFGLESKGPPHTPTLNFYITPQSNNGCVVMLHFRNHITPPFHVMLRLFGIVKWTREMHLKDLDGLRRYVENAENYKGQPLQKALSENDFAFG
ncbi:MAG: hypothetical protein AAF652_10975 [Cyanobacteria bacterium P01_C01_bin.72]